MKQRCAKCNLMFEAEGEWQKICKVCYKQVKTKELDDYKIKIKQLENTLSDYALKVSILKNELSNKPLTFTDKEYNQLILLCHPDKHDNSTLSNEVTMKLIKLKKGKSK